jgi:hypothetical protein
LGKIVVASGVTMIEKRKNLVIVPSRDLERAVRDNLLREPEPMDREDYRFWDLNDRVIKEVYESL